jgi:hypothetical protein
MSLKLNHCNMCIGNYSSEIKIANHTEVVCFGCFEKIVFRTLYTSCPYIMNDDIVKNIKCYSCCLSKYHLISIQLCDSHYSFIKDLYKINTSMDLDEDM